MTPEELVSRACPKIGDLGWAYYFAPGTLAKGESLGLDAFHFYFLGRGGVLGDVEPEVVVSAFGYFNPAVVAQMWNEGKAIMAPREAARAYAACCADLGRARLGGLADLAGFCAAAETVAEAADPVGLSLFAGFRAEPLVDDLPGRALQLLALLREFRGSAHLLAVRASGLDAKTAHFLRRPNDVGMFGWSEDDPPLLGGDQVAALARADALTDSLVRDAYGTLDEAGGRALLAGLDGIEVALAA
jgi:hypothetical protein